MAYIDEATKASERIVATIQNDKDIPDSTKELLIRHIQVMRANGLNDRTINKRLYSFAVFLKTIGNKDPLKLTKEDIMEAIALLERTKYSPRTKVDIKISIKAMYKHFLGNDEYYPEQVRWIKTTIRESNKRLPEDILTEDDVLRILEATTDMRDKALIALLFDSGVRLGELLGMRIKDIDLTTEPSHVMVDGKTGMRKIPIMFSVPYIARYLDNRHNAEPTDYLWNVRGSWSNMNRPIDRSGIVKLLKLSAQKAGIKKHVNPHSWRHARATYYASRITEQQLKQFFGWTGSSKMASVYVHMSGRDLDNGILKANGINLPEHSTDPKLKAVVCPKCRTINGVEALYCNRCGSALNITVALAQDRTDKLMSEYMDDPFIINRIAKLEQKKRLEPKKDKALKSIQEDIKQT